MALVGRRDGRNVGYGRQLSYAVLQALRDLFGGGHYGTVMQPRPARPISGRITASSTV